MSRSHQLAVPGFELMFTQGLEPSNVRFERQCVIHLTVVGGSRQETLDPGFVLLGTRQQGVPVILRELMLPGGFDPVSPTHPCQPPSNLNI
ncbi:unnamed protein product [Schistosoma mattheei]|uniref:Uncharacterized protein n=1 Tax=Schistosoma mattheei TaxID=31246 RepID=A0A183P3E3_9TREM|nr:unnamed protein product [Schistosoma mattheei]